MTYGHASEAFPDLVVCTALSSKKKQHPVTRQSCERVELGPSRRDLYGVVRILPY